MPSYVPGRRVAEYFIQRANVNPLGRQSGWITVDQTDDPADAKQRAQALRSHNPGMKTRIVKRATIRGGYSSL